MGIVIRDSKIRKKHSDGTFSDVFEVDSSGNVMLSQGKKFLSKVDANTTREIIATDGTIAVSQGTSNYLDLTNRPTALSQFTNDLGNYGGFLTASSLSGYATQAWVTSTLIDAAPDALNTLNELAAALGDDPNFATTVTNNIAGKVAKSGDTMTGNITWNSTELGLVWTMNTDGAYIKFFNTGDGDTNSRLEYATSDNGDEYHRFMVAGVERMAITAGGISATGYNKSNWDTAYGWGNHRDAGYLTSLPSHTHDYLSSDSDSEQAVGGNTFRFNLGGNRANIDPRWNESGYDADLGVFHMYATTSAGASWGRTGIALYNGSAYQYLTTRGSTTGIFLNNQEIIHAGNIGSQSVNYAASAGAVAWGNVSGRPTALSSFTNDLGNYGGWLTTSGKAADSELLDGINSSSFVRNDTTAQYLRPYYQYSSYLTTETPLTLANQMGGDGMRVDFMNNGGGGSWNHVITFSGYNAYNMYQLGGYYDGGSTTDLYVRSEANHGRTSWTAWRKLWHTGHFTDSNISNWNTAYGWGNHASAGYLTSLPSHTHDDRYYTESESDDRFLRVAANSSSPTNATFAIGTASDRNFIQSHSGRPLDINPLGNTVTINGNAAIHAGNIGSQSVNYAGSAGSISGFNNPTTGATANTIAYRDSGGDLYARYMFAVHFNQSGGNSENPTIGQIWTQNTSDNYVRKSTPAHFISQLGLVTTSNIGSYAVTSFSPDARYSIGLISGNGTQTRDKIRVWDGSEYTIGMKNGYDYGHLGNDEYAMSFQMNNNSGRGFWWGDTDHNDNQGAASLTTDGRMVIAKSLSIGEGESVTAPSSTPLYAKGATSGADVLAIDGLNGRLFTVKDDLSDSLFAVNTVAGLPVIEAYADNTVKIGKYGNATTFSNDGTVTFQNEGIKMPYYNGGTMWFRTNTHWDSVSGIDVIGGSGEFRISSDTGAINLRVDGSLLASDNLYVGYLGWLSNNLNQNVRTDAGPTFAEVYNNGWFRTTGHQGLYNPTNDAHFYPNDLSHGAWRLTGTRGGWNGLHFGGTNGITLMMNEGEFGFYRNGIGWVGRFTSGYFDGTAAAANSVAWGNVTGKPSTFTASGGNADTVAGLAVHGGRNNEANKIVRTQSNGYVDLGWINTPSGDRSTTVPNKFYGSDDDYIRYYDRPYTQMYLGNTYKYSTARRQHTTDTNYWVGSMGWGTTDFNTVFTWGSGFIDTWSSPGNRPTDSYSHFVGLQAMHYTSATTDNYGFQLVMGGGRNSPLYYRASWASNGDWYTLISSANIGSQSVNYASSAGNADTVDGWHRDDLRAWGNLTGVPSTFTPSSHTHDDRYYTESESDGRFQPLENQRLSTGNAPTFAEVYNNGWFRTTGHQGLYSPTNEAHFYPNNASYGAWRITGTRNGWNGLHFGGANGITLMMNEGEFGFHREGVGWVARFTSRYFDGTAASADSVAWGNVSGRPSAVSSFTNDSGYITSGGRAYPRRSDGGDLNFYWSGQGGQPTWLWGGNDGANMYVYNPSNFSVNYASSAGTATTATNQDGGYVSAGTGGINELYANNVYANVYYRKDNTGWYMNPGNLSNMNIIFVDRIDNYGWITNSNWNTAGMFYVGEAGDSGAYPVQVNAVRWDLSIYAPNGPIWGNGIRDISDLKLKTNIATIESPIEKIKDLRGVTYQWKHINDGKTHAGFIAQEVEVVLPDLVSTTIDPETLGEIKGVNYSGVIPYLVESIKLQQAMIEDLQARLALLENNS